MDTFHLSSINGDIEAVRKCIRKGWDVNIKDQNGDSPLNLAAENGNLDVIQELIQAGADVDRKGRNGDSPLHLAAEKGNSDVIQELILAGADVDRKGRNGDSPLHLAAEKGNLDVIQELILAGADVDRKGLNGNSPLHLVAAEGRLDIVHALIQAGADVNIKNENGYSPLHLAAEKGNLDVIQELIQAGADVDIKEWNGESPLHLAAEKVNLDVIQDLIQMNQSPLHIAAAVGHLDVIHVLIQHGVDVNVKNQYGLSPLHMAAEKGHSDVTQSLIQAGADVNVKNENNKSPLHLAAARGQLDVIEMLVQAGAEVYLEDLNGNSPLHLAAAEGHLDAIRALIQAGADVNVKDTYNCCPLHLASQRGHVDVLHDLICAGADANIKAKFDNSPLHLAAEKGHLDVIRILIQAGADVNITDKDGESTLHLAAERGHLDVIQALIQADAEVNVKDRDGKSPLHLAIERGPLDVIQALIQGGADVNVKDENGESPLHLAAVRGQLGVIQALIQADAEVNVKDKDGKSPLHLAARRRQLDVLQALIQAGADVNVKDTETSFALHLAVEEVHKDVVKLLILSGVDVNVKNKNGKTAMAIASSSMRKVLRECEEKRKNVPKEIRILGPRATLKYLFALEDNSAISNTIRVMLVGHFGVGKTTIAMNLLERKVKRIDSTNGIEVYINQCVYDEKEDKWITEIKYKDTLFGIDGIIRLDLVDFAGQLIFYTTHQTYLTSRGLYLLVFNLAMGLDTEVCDEDLHPGKSKRRVIDFLDFWIATIVTYARGEDVNFPKIILVGTHKDKIKDKSDLELIKREITEKFQSMVTSSQLVLRDELFISAENMSEETRKSIRDTILEEGKKYKEFGENIPASWIALQEKLMQLKGKKNYIISMEKVRQINRDMDTPLDDEELNICLRYLHNMGSILYFSTPALKEKIILDPKILIDAMKCFITCERFVTNRSIRNEWRHMRKCGEVQRSHILKVWEGKGLSQHADHLFATMKRLDLLCDPMIYSYGQRVSSNFFVVPSMIDAARPTVPVVDAPEESKVALVFSSETLLPPAIFNRLVCSCLALWPVFNQHLYNGQVVIKSGRFHLLELVRDVRKITVAISHIESTKRPDVQLCLAIRQFLTETINQIVAVYSTTDDGPIACDSSNLDVFFNDTNEESGRYEEYVTTDCRCEEYAHQKLEDVNLMRIARQLQRLDLSVVCTALLNDAGFEDVIEKNFKQFYGDVKVFYVLQEWKQKTRNINVAKLRQLFQDHLEHANKHWICKAMIEAVSSPDDIPPAILISKVNPEFLNAVADKTMPTKNLHLGLELGLTLSEMEQLKIDNQKVIEVTRAMLFTWYEKHKEDATVLNLAKAYKRCGEENLEWIGSEFDLEKMIQRDDTHPIDAGKNKCSIT